MTLSILFVSGILFEAAAFATGRRIFTVLDVSLMGLAVWVICN